ncbi:MAG: hypothetical protein KBD76_01685 [Bacteriovorax sp.]|nr:hypothetical protein [Bacteriovorax sp.]
MKKYFNLFYSFLLIVLFYGQSGFSIENSLNNFETDGCTLFIEGPAKTPTLWRHCCTLHDMRYWFGGSLADRDTADLRLRDCVKDVSTPFWAELIYQGVKLGHSSPVKNKTHWSWGWKNERKNSELSPEESHYVLEELRRLPLDHQLIEHFIQRNF